MGVKIPEACVRVKRGFITMHGLGTLINALAIIAGGLLGIGCKRFLKEHYQETIMKAMGFAVVFLGAAGTLSKMLVFTEDGTGLTDHRIHDHDPVADIWCADRRDH